MTATVACGDGASAQPIPPSFPHRTKRIARHRTWCAAVAFGAFGLPCSSAAFADDHGDSRDTATEASVPGTVDGRIDPGDDEDYFRFALSSAGTLVARTSGGLDTRGTLYDASGGQLATNDDVASVATLLNFRIEHRLDAGT